MSTTYNIELNISGNYGSTLDSYIQKTRELQGAAAGVGGAGVPGGGGGGGRRGPNWRQQFRNIPAEHLGTYHGINRSMSRLPGLFNNRNLMRNINKSYKATEILSSDFYRYGFTINGLRKNIGNFVNLLASIGRTITTAIPAIGGIVGGAKGYIAASAVPALLGGGAYLVGNRLLNNRNMIEASANLTQYNAARMGLGPEYERIYKSASETAATYGFSRAGIVNATNVLRGMMVGGKQIDAEQASDLARIIGKISQAGGRPYDIVSLNLQQLLGQAKPHSRDIRELIGQAPMISKIAQQRMLKDTGKVGDVREWLADKNNLLWALQEYDKLIKPPAVAAMRGRLSLRKEQMWMDVATKGEPFFEKVTQAGERLYDILGTHIGRAFEFLNRVDLDTYLRKFSNSVDTLLQAGQALLKVGNAIGVGSLDNLYSTVGLMAGLGATKGAPMPVRVIGIVAASLVGAKLDERRRYTQAFNEAYVGAVDQSAGAAMIPYIQNQLALQRVNPDSLEVRSIRILDSMRMGAAWKQYLESDPDILGSFDGRDKSNWLGTKKWTEYSHTPKPLKDWRHDDQQGLAMMAADWFREKSGSGGGGGGGSDYNAELLSKIDKLSEGRKAVYINFNKEIVNMPTTIHAADATDIGRKLRPVMEDVVSRGMTAALSQATRNG